jgi:hypothetical protein
MSEKPKRMRFINATFNTTEIRKEKSNKKKRNQRNKEII